jgi:hypothetical protein
VTVLMTKERPWHCCPVAVAAVRTDGGLPVTGSAPLDRSRVRTVEFWRLWRTSLQVPRPHLLTYVLRDGGPPASVTMGTAVGLLA